MADTILVSQKEPSNEALHVALLLSHVAWNRAIGSPMGFSYRDVLNQFLAMNRRLWKELKSNKAGKLIDLLIEYKNVNHPDDRREITSCGTTTRGTVRVMWLERKRTN
jgi:hypothetical protein